MTNHPIRMNDPEKQGKDEASRLRLSILATVVILLVELAGGYFSGSLALLSDAGHMFVDSLSLLLSYVAIRLAARPVSARFTYGLRRIEILAALINGVALLIVCASIMYEGVKRFLVPLQVDVPMMLGIATIGLGANIVSALLLRHAVSLNVRSAFLHVLGDLFSSIGILIAGTAMLLWDVRWLDPAVSIAIAVVILVSAYRLTREAVGVLLEAAPESMDTKALHAAMLSLPYVDDVHDLHVWTITSGVPALSCHVVAKSASGHNNDAMLAGLSALLQERFGIGHSTIQIETPSYRDTDICSPC